jgi:membrane-bound ClpP family serine protease
MMIVVGVVLVLVGVALLVAEAHLPAGVLGTAGGLSLAGGAALAVAGAGAGLALVIPIAVGAGAIAALWLAIAARGVLASRSLKTRSGREALSGRTGTVRTWAGGDGQVLVDGALWSARPSLPEECSLSAGDEVVVERVSGLTLAVRKAEEWESPWS